MAQYYWGCMVLPTAESEGQFSEIVLLGQLRNWFKRAACHNIFFWYRVARLESKSPPRKTSAIGCKCLHSIESTPWWLIQSLKVSLVTILLQCCLSGCCLLSWEVAPIDLSYFARACIALNSEAAWRQLWQSLELGSFKHADALDASLTKKRCLLHSNNLL